MGPAFNLHIAYARRKFINGAWLLSACMLTGGCAGAAFAQATPAGSYYQSGVAVTVGVTNTQFPFYSDNAVGGSIAIFFQKSTFFGVQAMASAYPYKAKFIQAPVTVGYRVGTVRREREPSLWRGWDPFAYAGGGFSYAQDSSFNFVPIAATADPCLQGSIGIDHQQGHFTWRVAEISWTETYTSIHHLRTIGVSTGFVYNFAH